MNKQTLRMVSWAAGALLVTLSAFVIPGCGSDDSPSQPIITSGSGGSSSTGGNAGTSGAGGLGGSSATGGSGSTGGSTGGTSGNSGTGGTDQDAGGSAGTAGEGGGAGYGSAPLIDGGDADAGGAGGSDADAGGAAGYSSAPSDDGGDAEAGTGGTAGSGGTSGSGGSSGAGGTAGTGGSNTGGTGSTDSGTGGTIVVPCPADCSGHGSCDTSNGTCACDTGFNAPDCGSCAAGYKNYPTCYAIQSCPANCSGHGTCNDQTGACTCDSGYDTASCGACASGFTGYPKCQVIPTPFACVNPTRNAAFDQFKIDNIPAWLAGGIWGTNDTNVYVSAMTYDKGVIAHWDGSTWAREDLPGNPMVLGNVWGSSSSDVWVPARIGAQTAALYHKTGAVWAQDPNQPTAWEFNRVWGVSANTIFLAGRGGSFPPKPMTWKKQGSSWVSMPMPTLTGSTAYHGLWGTDENHVFQAGEQDADNNGNSDQGVLLYSDGSTWTSVQVPTDCRELYAVHGTSSGDLWTAGVTTTGKGVVYHVTDNLTTWTAHVNENLYGYGSIFSARPGTALASGASEPHQAGNLKITTIDQVNQPDTYSVDGIAYGGAVAIWYNAGKVWWVSIRDDGQQYPSGVYTMDCN